MADKWELCAFSQGTFGGVTFHTGTSKTHISMNDFINKYKLEPIQYLLANGWEPFQIITGAWYFRRKVSS